MKTLRQIWIAAIVFAWAAPALAQTPPPPPRPTGQSRPPEKTAKAPAGSSRITGRVLRADTGAPVRRAFLLLTGEALPEGRSVMSDAEGRYDSGDLPAGSYRIKATKDGLLDAEFGAKAYGDPGQPVKIGEKEKMPNADIAMIRGGSIAGRVFDEYGDAVTSANVQVLRGHNVEGVRRLEVAGTSVNGRTDDLGQYRIFGLRGGTYVVTASLSPRDSEVDPQRTKLVTTYYPGTASLEDARPLDLAAGQDLTGVDLPLMLVRTARLSGTCVDAEGRPLALAYVSASLIVGGTRVGGIGGSTSVDNSGTFSISGLPPGEYSVVASTVSQGRGAARVSIGSSDVSGILIQVNPGSTLTGQVLFEDNQLRPSIVRRVALSAAAADPGDLYFAWLGDRSSGYAEVRDDATFVMTGLFGERFVSATPPSGWALKGVFQRGRDITDTPISFDGRETIGDVQIVLTDRVTHLTATVAPETAGGVPEDAEIVVAADDPARWKPGLGGRYKRRMFSQDGSVAQFDGLPPGDYFAVAVADARAPDMLLDPDVLEQIRRSGQRFSLKDGETKTITLKVTRQR